MKIASIDIGSNTVLLLIADVINSEIIPIINEYRIPRISSGLTSTGKISEESMQKLFAVLTEYKTIIDKNNCDKVIVNGTQALRVASNSEIIRTEIKKQFGFDLNIVEGETEALYSFRGALSSFTDDNNYVMIDIGGASTEIVFGNKTEIFFKKSFPIGVVVSRENFLNSNPPTSIEISSFRNELKNIFKELAELDFRGASIISVAGTPTTLSALKLGLEKYSDSKIEKSILTKSDLENYSAKFEKLTYSEIEKQFSPLISGREDVILAGTLILHHILINIKIDKLFVSSRGLRYGALV